MSAGVDLRDHFPRLAGIFAGGDVMDWVHEIQEMMRNSRPLGRARFGSADFKLAIGGNGIAVHNLAGEPLRESQRQSCLSAPRGTEHDHKQSLALGAICVPD